MGLNNYDIIYLLSNVFGTYIIYKFMSGFFNKRNVNHKVEIVSYISYFAIIGVIHIIFNLPIINLISNLVLFLLLTLNYSSTWKYRLAAVVFMFTILISVETITIVILEMSKLNSWIKGINMQLIIALIISKIISYIVVLIIGNFKMLKAEVNISPLHWIAVFTIPLGTLFATYILMIESDQENFKIILISIAILFGINIFVFYLYDVLLQSYQEKMDRNFLIQQNNAYIQQLNVINQSQETFRILRHDFKNHILTLQAYIEKKDNAAALQYLQSTFNYINYGNEYAKSGNGEIDSILNYKIYEAQQQKIDVELKLQVPGKLNVKPFDLAIILGNLLDNAIEATQKVEEGRKIHISIEFERNILYIAMSNAYQEKLIYKNNRLKTTRKDKVNHGFGLTSIQTSIEKYNGTMNIRHTENEFFIDVLLYNSVSSSLR